MITTTISSSIRVKPLRLRSASPPPRTILRGESADCLSPHWSSRKGGSLPAAPRSLCSASAAGLVAGRRAFGLDAAASGRSPDRRRRCRTCRSRRSSRPGWSRSADQPAASLYLTVITLPDDGPKATLPAPADAVGLGRRDRSHQRSPGCPRRSASCAVTRLRRSDFIDATTAFSFVLANFGIAMAAKMPMITTTINSSIRVKPLRFIILPPRE